MTDRQQQQDDYFLPFGMFLHTHSIPSCKTRIQSMELSTDGTTERKLRDNSVQVQGYVYLKLFPLGWFAYCRASKILLFCQIYRKNRAKLPFLEVLHHLYNSSTIDENVHSCGLTLTPSPEAAEHAWICHCRPRMLCRLSPLAISLAGAALNRSCLLA